MTRHLLLGVPLAAIAALVALTPACSDSLATTASGDQQPDASADDPDGGDNGDNGNADDAADPCTDYCNAVQASCTGGFGAGGNSQYASAAGCMNFCDQTLGTDSTTRDSLTCRMTHAQRAKSDPKAECPMAGTTGGGVCVGDTGDGGDHGRCAAFCNRAVQICTKDNGVDPLPFDSVDSCMAQCGSKFPFDPGQPELTDSGNTLNCRQYYLMLAWDGTGANTPQYHCPHLAFPATAFCQ